MPPNANATAITLVHTIFLLNFICNNHSQLKFYIFNVPIIPYRLPLKFPIFSISFIDLDLIKSALFLHLIFMLIMFIPHYTG